MKLILLSFIFFGVCNAYFNLPGVKATNYERGSTIQIKVNKLDSIHTQVPFSFYELPFCQPTEIVESVENLGEIILGDRIDNSLYNLSVAHDTPCTIVCEVLYSVEQLKEFAKRIDEEYRVHWLLDNFPSAVQKPNLNLGYSGNAIYEEGFPLGIRGEEVEGARPEQMYINNHLNIKVYYHEDPAKFSGVRIVGFEVEPDSRDHEIDEEQSGISPISCQESTQLMEVTQDKPTRIVWTYTATWTTSEKPWALRWDIYLQMVDDQIHWFSIINSMMIVFFLTGMVAIIMLRTLDADLKRYSEVDDQESGLEETGWKLVHGDVFRPPTHGMFLSVFVGNGVQIMGMVVFTICFAILGFMSPANRGGLMTALVVLFVLMGLPAGYASSRLYKIFKGKMWQKNAVLVSMGFSGIAFTIFSFINVFLRKAHSSAAVPFTTFFSLITLWWFISVPLAFFGAYLGWKQPVPEFPCRTNQIPRQIPEQVWYLRPVYSSLIGGILPFGAIFVELYFILTSIWLHQFYYVFGFLFIVLLILFVTCVEISIVNVYFQLCSEDYHWWWRGFMTSATSALYMFCYSIFYFNMKLSINGFLPKLLYFGYTSIMTSGFFFFTGAIGFFGTYFFVRKIYSSVKVD